MIFSKNIIKRILIKKEEMIYLEMNNNSLIRRNVCLEEFKINFKSKPVSKEISYKILCN